MAALVLVSGCHPPPDEDEVVGVTAVADRIMDWDGQHVTVDGWLGTCRGFDCRMFPDERSMRIAANGAFDDAWHAAYETGLGVGVAPGFDARAQSMQFRRVHLKARVNAICSGLSVCTDRAPDLEPIAIELVKD